MLIEKEKVLNEMDKIRKLTDEQTEAMKIARSIVENEKEVEAIPIDWLHKELVEMVFDDEMDSNQMAIYHRLISRWRKCA